ncbi:MAG: Fis family transcriptional regulator [Proteobacteria bacterium]|nr:Fis family transcriptional regulator [Pseudomonadota bacterium]
MSKNMGSSFDDFLAEEGLLTKVQAEAAKRVLVWELEKFMIENSVSKSKLAEMLRTSRSNVDRILDESNLSITLGTMANIAQLTGKKMQVSFG